MYIHVYMRDDNTSACACVVETWNHFVFAASSSSPQTAIRYVRCGILFFVAWYALSLSISLYHTYSLYC